MSTGSVNQGSLVSIKRVGCLRGPARTRSGLRPLTCGITDLDWRLVSSATLDQKHLIMLNISRLSGESQVTWKKSGKVCTWRRSGMSNRRTLDRMRVHVEVHIHVHPLVIIALLSRQCGLLHCWRSNRVSMWTPDWSQVSIRSQDTQLTTRCKGGVSLHPDRALLTFFIEYERACKKSHQCTLWTSGWL